MAQNSHFISSPISRMTFFILVISTLCVQTVSGMQWGPMKRADNLQTFTGSLGQTAPAITNSGDSERPYEVSGNNFPDFPTAAQRSCDVQFNTCQLDANSGASFSLTDCETQQSDCNSAQSSATVTTFNDLAVAASTTAAAAAAQETFDDGDFFIVCDA